MEGTTPDQLASKVVEPYCLKLNPCISKVQIPLNNNDSSFNCYFSVRNRLKICYTPKNYCYFDLNEKSKNFRFYILSQNWTKNKREFMK